MQGGQGRGRGAPEVSPRDRASAAGKKPGWRAGERRRGRAARGKPGLRREGSVGGVQRRRGRPRPPPQPGACPVTYPPGSCGLLRGCPGRRPPGPGSAPTSRAGAPSGPGAPDSPRPSSLPSPPAAETCPKPGPLRHRRGDQRAGWLTADQRRAGSAGAGFAAAAAAMVKPARLRPGPGKRRLCDVGDSVPGCAQPQRLQAKLQLRLLSAPPPLGEPEPEPARGGAWWGRGIGRLQTACAAPGGAADQYQWVPLFPFSPQVANSRSDTPAAFLLPHTRAQRDEEREETWPRASSFGSPPPATLGNPSGPAGHISEKGVEDLPFHKDCL